MPRQTDEREYTEPTRRGCNRCGSKTVAWQTNASGKWYLTEVFEDAEGRTYTERTLFHSHFCKDPEEHELEQAKRISIETKTRKETTKARREREERNATEEAAYFLELHDLCKNERGQAIDQLAAKERERDNWTSMDHFVEASRERARVARLTAEIAFMKAALGMATEYDDDE